MVCQRTSPRAVPSRPRRCPALQTSAAFRRPRRVVHETTHGRGGSAPLRRLARDLFTLGTHRGEGELLDLRRGVDLAETGQGLLADLPGVTDTSETSMPCSDSHTEVCVTRSHGWVGRSPSLLTASSWRWRAGSLRLRSTATCGGGWSWVWWAVSWLSAPRTLSSDRRGAASERPGGPGCESSCKCRCGWPGAGHGRVGVVCRVVCDS